ncbi:MAG TPA: sensor histidine kinase, partial [Verrucomicrobiae bacterium]|nr:sensor histidine kinase [Verrucomicrobiae bacterium]
VETKWLDWAPDESTRSSWVRWRYRRPQDTVITNISQLSALRTEAGLGIPIRIAATVAGHDGNRVCLVDSTGCISFSNLDAAQRVQDGQAILVSGVSQWMNNQVGITAASIQLPYAMTSLVPQRISLGQALPAGENLKWAEIEGDMGYSHLTASELSFDIQDGQSSMRVCFPYHDEPVHLPAPGTRVLVRGVCQGGFNERGDWVAATLWAAGPGSLRMAETNSTDETLAPLRRRVREATLDSKELSTIQQIRQLTPEQMGTHPRVKIRGVVTDELQGFVQDDTAGIEAAFSPDAKRKTPAFGDYIQIDGWAQLDDVGSPEIWADQITVLGKGKLPTPKTLTPDQLAAGRIDAQWIDAEGVVRSTDGSHLLLTCYGQQMMATITEAPVELVNDLVDADVRVCGVGVTARDNQGRIQGIHMLIPSLAYIDVLSPPPNPERLPVRKIGSLVGLSGPGGSFHRVKVEGVVTLQQNQRVFLQDDTGNAMVILKENVVLDARFGRRHWLYWQTTPSEVSSNSDTIFNPGDRVQVIGFPETHRYAPVLTQATVTRLGGAEILKPVPLSPDGLADGSLDSGLVTFDGELRGRTVVGANTIFDLEWQDRTLQVLMPSENGDSFRSQLGSTLRVTGVCQIDPPSWPELGLVPGPVRILTRSADDLTVLARPPWWTVRRALALVGGMVLVMLIGLLWIRELRRQVGDRTRQLAAEIQLRERVESRHALEQERARIARDLHDDLGANLTQIVFLSERVEVARHDGQEGKPWFNLIPATAQRTIQSLDEIVWAINPQHDSLESLANYLSQFAQQHLTLAQIRCVLDVPTVLPPVPLSAEVRHNLLLVAREALQNVVTHARATEVRLVLQLTDDCLRLTISDNGKGFDPDLVSAHGNGLKNMRQRIQSIGGQLEITSASGLGSNISFSVPRAALHGRVIGRNQNSGQDV